METRGNLNNQEATEFDEDLICEAFEFLTFLGDYLEKKGLYVKYYSRAKFI